MPHEVDIRVGKKMREVRVSRGMSQEQLSRLLNISFQQVQKYEKAANRISASRLWEIAKILEVPVIQFFEDVDKTEGEPLSRRAIKLANEIESIADETVRDRLLSLIKACTRMKKD